MNVIPNIWRDILFLPFRGSIVTTAGKTAMDIREAGEKDNEALLELTRLSPMKGVISLCIERRPDFFALVRYRGESKLLVAEDKGKVIGSFSSAKRQVIINGRTETVYYLADFKVHPAHRGSTASLRLVKSIVDDLLGKSAELVFSTASEGNENVMPFFKGRAGIHEWYEAGRFSVVEIIPSRLRPRSHYAIVEEVPQGQSLQAFFQKYYTTQYAVAPVIRSEDLSDGWHLIAMDGDEIVAAIQLKDTFDMKQTIVMGIPLWLQIVIYLLRITGPLVGLRALPRVGHPLRMLNIRYWACLPGREDALRALVRSAMNLAARQRYHFLSVGLHEKDPLLHLFKSFIHVPFTARGFIIIKDEAKIKTYTEGVIFEDFTAN